MKNLNDLAIELAQKYGIEISNTPNQHIIKTENGEVSIYENDLLYEVFGFVSPNKTSNLEQLIEVGSKSCSFKVNENSAGDFEKLFVNNEIMDSEIAGNYQYAMAA